MEKNIQIYRNKYWDDNPKRDSIMTPVFNRREELPRALYSIKNQTYNDFEYIIVNDGSTIDIDDIVFNFMNFVSFPLLYIKKENGGVHTARNLAVSFARGEMICCCDSDDELMPDAIEKLIGVWNSIPEDKKLQYREICARCIDEQGVERLETVFDLQVEPMPNSLKGTEYLYDHPEARAEDLMAAFRYSSTLS